MTKEDIINKIEYLEEEEQTLEDELWSIRSQLTKYYIMMDNMNAEDE